MGFVFREFSSPPLPRSRDALVEYELTILIEVVSLVREPPGRMLLVSTILYLFVALVCTWWLLTVRSPPELSSRTLTPLLPSLPRDKKVS